VSSKNDPCKGQQCQISPTSPYNRQTCFCPTTSTSTWLLFSYPEVGGRTFLRNVVTHLPHDLETQKKTINLPTIPEKPRKLIAPDILRAASIKNRFVWNSVLLPFVGRESALAKKRKSKRKCYHVLCSPKAERGLFCWRIWCLSPLVRLLRAALRCRSLWSIGELALATKHPSTRTQTSYSDAFFFKCWLEI